MKIMAIIDVDPLGWPTIAMLIVCVRSNIHVTPWAMVHCLSLFISGASDGGARQGWLCKRTS